MVPEDRDLEPHDSRSALAWLVSGSSRLGTDASAGEAVTAQQQERALRILSGAIIIAGLVIATDGRGMESIDFAQSHLLIVVR
jgi:hypothetical protein